MSSPNSSDPRLLLPDWLRDGDTPLPAPAESKPLDQSVATAELVEVDARLTYEGEVACGETLS